MTNSKKYNQRDFSNASMLSKPKHKMNDAEKQYAQMEVERVISRLPEWLRRNPELLKDARDMLYVLSGENTKTNNSSTQDDDIFKPL